MKIVFINILLIISINIYGQNGSIWYFGGGDASGLPTNDASGLDFTTNPPTALPGGQGQLRSFEGNASLSDNYGNLFFYTDGNTVYDKTHTFMPNGFSLFGSSSSTQSAVIGPVPGSSEEFYVFTNKSLNILSPNTFNGLSYSKIDMSLAGNGTSSCPLGDVVLGVKNIPLADSTNEKVTLVAHSNGTDYWVLCQRTPWNNITAFLVTAAGVNVLPAIAVTSSSPFWGGLLGELKASPNGNYLALAQLLMRDPSIAIPAGYVQKSELQILGFDPSNGTINLSTSIKLDSLTSGMFGFYGVEFSSSGDYLYANNDVTNELYQFDMNAANIPASKIIIGTGQQGSLQLGPDNKIYQAKSNNNAIDVINNPNSTGLASNFVASGQSLGTGVCKNGLPNSPKANIFSSVFTDYIANDTSTCAGDTIFLGNFIKPNHTYSWTPSGSLNNSNLANPQAYPLVTTTYYLQAIHHCDTIYDSITITITQGPSPVLYTNSPICEGDLLTISCTPIPGACINCYNWTTTTGLVFNPNGLSSANILLAGTNLTGTYYVSVLVGNCLSPIDSIDVTVLDFPIHNGITGNNVCIGESTELVSLGIGNLLWNDNSSNDTLFVSPLIDTFYSSSYSNICGVEEDTIFIEVYPLPIINAYGDTTVFSLKDAYLSVTGGSTYVWSPSSDLSCSTCENPIANVTETTIFYVTVTDSNGCIATDSVEVKIEEVNNLYIPNVFSPNDDGYNDVLFVRGTAYQDISFRIFNRWGEKVFETTDITKGWDGTQKGKVLNPGVFVYQLIYTDWQNIKQEKSGNVTLIR